MEQELLGNEDDVDEELEMIENARWNAFKAVLMLFLGTAIAAAFAHPFEDYHSSATSIPPFFVGFIVLPFFVQVEGRQQLAMRRITQIN